MEEKTPARKQLERDAKRVALTRKEDATRTEKDFNEVVNLWNGLDKNRRRRERYWEVVRPNAEMLHWDKTNPNDEKGQMKSGLDTVIPPPLEHPSWRQLLRGDFLDVILDCPYELREQTSSLSVSTFVQELTEKQKEILYYSAIRLYSPQRIAKIRGQTDRNIRKVYANLVKELRAKLYARLYPRYDADLPLTFNQQEFVKNYRAGAFDKKAALDEKSGER